MTPAINPLAMLLQSAAGRTANGGGPPSPGEPPSSGGEYAQQVSELRGADPGMLLRELKQMKQKCAVLMVQNLERLPNVAGQLAKIVPSFDRVIKEVMQAGNVSNAIRPIQMGAAQPAQPEGQPSPMSNSF